MVRGYELWVMSYRLGWGFGVNELMVALQHFVTGCYSIFVLSSHH